MELGLKVADAATAGAKMPLRHPVTNLPLEDDGKPVCLILAGKDSVQYRKAALALERRYQEDARRMRGAFQVTPEQRRANELKLLVAVTLGWENASYGGESTFSPELALAMYEAEDWVREQADAFVDDRSHFVMALPTI